LIGRPLPGLGTLVTQAHSGGATTA